MTHERLEEIREWINNKYVCHTEQDLIIFRELLEEIERLCAENFDLKINFDHLVTIEEEDVAIEAIAKIRSEKSEPKLSTAELDRRDIHRRTAERAVDESWEKKTP